MTIVGDPGLWSNLFPDGFVPAILQLVCETWDRFPTPATDASEVPLTRRFRTALIRAKNLKQLPFRIGREEVEDDPETAEERGRKDLSFLPTNRAREEVYFCFECKRLHAWVGAKTVSLAAEYVKDGMLRFVTGQYSSTVQEGGMIGYVLDGRLRHAIQTVEANIRGKSNELRMHAPGSLQASRILKDRQGACETEHERDSGRLLIHHLFLNCPRKSKRRR